MRLRRFSTFAAVAVLAAALVPNLTASAHHEPAGAMQCALNGFVVKDATSIADPNEGGTNGRGVFGAALVAGFPVTSSVTCTGSISGSATVSGNFVWCPQLTPHDPVNNPHDPDNNSATPDPDPTDWDCNGASAHDTADEALYPGEVGGQEHPTNVHVIGTGKLTGGLAWVDVQGNPAPPECDFSFEGHALAPPLLEVSIDCDGHTFEGVATTGFVPILGPAGDSFTDPNAGPTGQPITCAEWGPNRPECFRAVIFSGDITAVAAP